MKLTVLIAAAALASAPAVAETVYQLNRDQIAAVAAAPITDDATTFVDAPVRDRGVHGEAGVAIGTGGYRSTFASMAVPLGENGYAAISVETGQFGNVRAATPRHGARAWFGHSEWR